MEVIVMSDSHGNRSNVEEIVKRNLDADMFIHLGDGEDEVNKVAADYPQIKIFHVAGNCDYLSSSPNTLELMTDYGHKIFATHGHRFAVVLNTDLLLDAARESGADIVLYGHTHCRFNEYISGTYVLNPGSASCPRDGKSCSFARISIRENGVSVNIADI